MPPKTRSEHAVDMHHILINVLKLEDDKKEAIHQALDREGIRKVDDIIQLDLSKLYSFLPPSVIGTITRTLGPT